MYNVDYDTCAIGSNFLSFCLTYFLSFFLSFLLDWEYNPWRYDWVCECAAIIGLCIGRNESAGWCTKAWWFAEIPNIPRFGIRVSRFGLNVETIEGTKEDATRDVARLMEDGLNSRRGGLEFESGCFGLESPKIRLENYSRCFLNSWSSWIRISW